MRLTHPSGRIAHLSYCTNVHAAEDLPGILEQLDTYAVPVRQRLGTDRLGLGLWIAAPAAADLADDPRRLRTLRDALDSRGLEVVTLNGFPYAAFQQPVVKHAVYHPNWTTTARLIYTLDLATVLCGLLPDDAGHGTVSTLPLAWRTPWDTGTADACRHNLDRLAGELKRLDRPIRIAVEPEPGCIIENTSQAADLLKDTDHEHIGICLDLAHLACAWEDPGTALAALHTAGIPIVKTQISAALASRNPGADAEALAAYVEPRFLHQTRAVSGSYADDLDEALARPGDQPWRVHYHVPLHAPPIPPLHATTDVVVAALTHLAGGPELHCEHLEVETYTWNVLPAALRPHTPDQLADGIAAELSWTRTLLETMEMTPC